MGKSTLKEIEIRLRPSSSLPDLTCIDGEVAEFRNVEWLKALTEKQVASSSGASSIPSATRLSLIENDLPYALPHGATLLAIHSPAALQGRSRFLILTDPDSLAILDPDDGSITYIAGNAGIRFGTIRRAVTHGDFILLITGKGLNWVVFDPFMRNYTLATSLPSAPQVAFSLSPAMLPRYTSMAGAWPELEIAIDLPLETGVSEAMFHNWLNSGIGSAVSEDVRAKVYRAIGKAVTEYEAYVAARGMFLTAPRCVASYDGVLPSSCTSPEIDNGYEYESPCARLASWGYHAGTLTLRLYFSLTPLQLSVRFNIPTAQKVWTDRFKTLQIATTASPAWHDEENSLTATAYTSYIDPETNTRDGYAFRFGNALSAEEIALRTLREDKFRIIEKNSIGNSTGGIILLSDHTPYPAGSLSGYTPDYRDLTRPAPGDAAAVDQGYILFGGGAEVYDSDGNKDYISMEKNILGSHPDYPFIFRYICAIGDGSVTGAVQAGGSRGSGSAGRHPVHILSTDGIRLLAANGEGGYINSRLISRIAVSPDSPVAEGGNAIFFMTATGFCSLAMNSAIKEYATTLSSGDWTALHMLGSDEALLLTSPGKTAIFDLQQKKYYFLTDRSYRSLHRHKGQIIAATSTGRMMTLHLLRQPDTEEIQTRSGIETDVYADDIPTGQLTLNQIPVSTGVIGLSDISDAGDSDESYILTRPLKLGNPFSRKRIRGVGASHPGITLTLEGSDDLTEWHILCIRHSAQSGPQSAEQSVSSGAGQSPNQPGSQPGRRLLPCHRLPACRYYRLKATAPESLAPHLAILSLLIQP